MNRNIKSKPTASTGKLSRAPNNNKGSKKPVAKPPGIVRQGLVKKKQIPKNHPGKSMSEHTFKRSDLQPCQKSSTPLGSPSKLRKIPAKSSNEDKELDALSDISKDSAPSSVCSSVSSGLIELLCHYNTKGENINIPEKDVCHLDDTLKNENTFSFVIPTDQPNCDGHVKILMGLLDRLKTTTNSILSSGDSRNVKRLEKLTEAMSNEFEVLKEKLPILWTQQRDFKAEVETIVAPLKAENASLQRKIRILNQNLAEKEKQNETDINLELETLQCMNNTLLSQVKKLSSLLQDAQDEKKKLEETIASVKSQNRKMTEDLLHKNKEFSRSQEIFSNEAGTIKSEVANALQKVDVLKEQLRHAETQNEIMKVSVQEKDEEVSRLNDLNKGLQSSVSRLLEDLQKARPRLERSSNRKVSSAILKNIEHVLNTPQEKPCDDSFWNDIEYRPNHLTRSYPPVSGKENVSQAIPPSMGDPLKSLYKSNAVDEYENVLESSRLSSLQTSDYPSSVISSSGMQNQAGSISRRQWDQISVCSSFVSFTTRDENDFANGLAILDADIQRLQESLHDMSEKPT